MIKIEHLETCGWEAAIRGMRNPKNSWNKSDSMMDYDRDICDMMGEDPINTEGVYMNQFVSIGENRPSSVYIGTNDATLMRKLCNGGPVHAKFRRMITVYCDITAPLYWWKEFDTYKVGTVANSCSTMHKLGEKEFELSDFSCENLMAKDFNLDEYNTFYAPMHVMTNIVENLNIYREKWLETKDKTWWYQMIQLLPSSYNQKRTVELNYEVLTGIYKWRKDHKLDEWREFCRIMKDELPESWIFTGEE